MKRTGTMQRRKRNMVCPQEKVEIIEQVAKLKAEFCFHNAYYEIVASESFER
jgi:hypothetical protein